MILQFVEVPVNFTKPEGMTPYEIGLLLYYLSCSEEYNVYVIPDSRMFDESNEKFLRLGYIRNCTGTRKYEGNYQKLREYFLKLKEVI